MDYDPHVSDAVAVAEPAPEIIPPGPSRPRRLLVVDEDESMRATVAALLHQAGYEAETSANAAEALQLGQLVEWSGLVLDVELSGLSGVEIYSRIVRRRENRRLPVVFLSNRTNEILRLGLHDAPWARVVQKPCDSREFLETLAHCFHAAEQSADPFSRPGPA